MEIHIAIPPLEECIVLDRHIQRFLSWAHKAKAHPLACLPWILMHKEVQVLQVDTTMVPHLAQSIHMRECRLTILHSRHHHPLCLRVSLCTVSRWWRRRTMSSCPRPPRPLLVINDKGGERCRLKACLLWSASAVCTNPVEPFSRSRWHWFQCVSASVSLLSGKLGGTEFPEPVAPVLAVGCNRPK
jgi:hypothetical protein